MSTTLTPYLAFNGNTREVFRFYEQALGAKIETMMSFNDMPKMPAPAEGCEGGGVPSGDGIMHACLALPGGARLMAGDQPAHLPYEGIKGAMMALQYDTTDQAQTVFHALSQGGQVTMPLAPASTRPSAWPATSRSTSRASCSRSSRWPRSRRRAEGPSERRAPRAGRARAAASPSRSGGIKPSGSARR